MRILFVSIAVGLFSAASAAQERLTMADNSESTSIKDAIRNAARAFSQEDLDSWVLCFKESRRPSARRQTARLFAEEECLMEIVDLHVAGSSETRASAFVKYKLIGPSASLLCFSEILLVKEEGEWRIEREVVKRSAHLRSDSLSLASAPNPGRAWDPMNPDPNRIPQNLHHLIGDIGIQEGFGCAGGKCANGRCEK